jgi:hypothetical protein
MLYVLSSGPNPNMLQIHHKGISKTDADTYIVCYMCCKSLFVSVSIYNKMSEFLSQVLVDPVFP